MEAARAWVAALCLLLLVGGREGVETGEFALGEEGFTSFEGAVEGEVDAGLQEREPRRVSGVLESAGAGRGPSAARRDGPNSAAPPPRLPPLTPPHTPPPPAGSVLLRFKASIPNWDAVAEAIRLDGWDEDTPVFLWSGVTFDLSMRLTRL